MTVRVRIQCLDLCVFVQTEPKKQEDFNVSPSSKSYTVPLLDIYAPCIYRSPTHLHTDKEILGHIDKNTKIRIFLTKSQKKKTMTHVNRFSSLSKSKNTYVQTQKIIRV